MRNLILIIGVVSATIAVFANQIGIDNDEGWGRGRVLLLTAGIILILAGLLINLLQDKIAKLKTQLLEFKNTKLNYSHSTQIILTSFAAAILILTIYIWFAKPLTKNGEERYNYYSELAIGFKAGNLYLAEKPSRELLSLDNPYDYFLRKEYNIEDFPWDVSLYNKKFYTYWGPAPSLLLTIFSNEQLVHIKDHYLALIFAYGLSLYSILIAASFWHKSVQNIPVWILWISLLTLGLSTPVTIMLHDSRIYEAAIFGCQFFFIGGCYWAYSSINNNKPVLWKLGFASLHWALALGTRITILPVILVSAVVTVIYILKVFNTTSAKIFIQTFAVMGVPLLIALSGLSWYNWARFGSIFEFGIKYQLTNVDYNVFQNSFSSQYIAGNLYNYFAHPIKILSKFPYMARIEYTPSNDRLAGLIYISPYLFLLFAPLTRMTANFPFTKTRANSQTTRRLPENWVITIFASSALISIFTILSFYFVTMRYIEDFMPSLLLLITIQFLQEYQLLIQNNTTRKILLFTAMIFAIITILAGVLVAMPKDGIAFMANFLNSVNKIFGLK